MEITGKVIFILPLRSGISKNGKEWKSQEFVIEIPGNYPRKICINIFGDKIDTFNFVTLLDCPHHDKTVYL